MVSLRQPPHDDTPSNLCELLLHNVAHLLIMNQRIKSALLALRPECEGAPELIEAFDDIGVINDRGHHQLCSALADAEAVLPLLNESSAGPVITCFLAGVPDRMMPGVMAADVVSKLRLLVLHLELSTKLAAEEASLVGQNNLSLALLDWSAEWRALSHDLRSVSGRLRARAYIADVTDRRPPLVAASA